MLPDGTLEWRAEDVDAATIDRQLSRLWCELHADTEHAAAGRTSIFNLVVYLDDPTELEPMSVRLANLPARQPSRALLLADYRRGEVARVDACVRIYCGEQAQPSFCHEHILMTARGRAADHPASLLIPLLLPDIPTYLWWPGQPPFGHRRLHRLLSVADQLVLDSAQFSAPGDGLADVAQLLELRQGINDFNWGRLAPWRSVLSQFFDGQNGRAYAEAIADVRLVFGTGGRDTRRATAGTLLLLGWLASRLGWQPETTLDGAVEPDTILTVWHGNRLIPINLDFSDHGSRAAGRLMAIHLKSSPDELPPGEFSVVRGEDLDHATISARTGDAGEVRRVAALEFKSDDELLADELELAGHDRLYEEVARMASVLAGREIWVAA